MSVGRVLGSNGRRQGKLDAVGLITGQIALSVEAWLRRAGQSVTVQCSSVCFGLEEDIRCGGHEGPVWAVSVVPHQWRQCIQPPHDRDIHEYTMWKVRIMFGALGVLQV